MKLAIGIVLGLCWGALAGLLNVFISKRAFDKNNTQAVMTANLLRTAVDFGALVLVYLLRELLPFSWEAMLIGTALALSAVTIVFAFLYGKKR